jgi:hypothetical protein
MHATLSLLSRKKISCFAFAIQHGQLQKSPSRKPLLGYDRSRPVTSQQKAMLINVQ